MAPHAHPPVKGRFIKSSAVDRLVRLAFQSVFVMAHRRGSDNANALVVALSPLGVVEKPCASTEKNGNDVNIQLINQYAVQVLLSDIRAAAQSEVFVLLSSLRVPKGRVNSFGDEVKGCAALHLNRLAGVVRDNEDRHVERRIVAPPTIPRLISPRSISAAKHVTSHDGCSDIVKIFLGDFIVGSGRASLHSVNRAKGPRRECPLVQLLTALAERILNALISHGHIAVE